MFYKTAKRYSVNYLNTNNGIFSPINRLKITICEKHFLICGFGCIVGEIFML